jgi:hypothetical protein
MPAGNTGRHATRPGWLAARNPGRPSHDDGREPCAHEDDACHGVGRPVHPEVHPRPGDGHYGDSADHGGQDAPGPGRVDGHDEGDQDRGHQRHRRRVARGPRPPVGVHEPQALGRPKASHDVLGQRPSPRRPGPRHHGDDEEGHREPSPQDEDPDHDGDHDEHQPRAEPGDRLHHGVEAAAAMTDGRRRDVTVEGRHRTRMDDQLPRPDQQPYEGRPGEDEEPAAHRQGGAPRGGSTPFDVRHRRGSAPNDPRR